MANSSNVSIRASLEAEFQRNVQKRQIYIAAGFCLIYGWYVGIEIGNGRYAFAAIHAALSIWFGAAGYYYRNTTVPMYARWFSAFLVIGHQVLMATVIYQGEVALWLLASPLPFIAVFGPRMGALLALCGLFLMDHLLGLSGTLATPDLESIRAKVAISYILIMATGLMLESLHRSMQRQLSRALDAVEHLEGFLTTCAFCNSIKDGSGNYVSMEKFLSDRYPVTFSHGYCETCVEKNFNDL